MTTTLAQLRQLRAAGVPIGGTLDGLHTHREPAPGATVLLLHRTPLGVNCRPDVPLDDLLAQPTDRSNPQRVDHVSLQLCGRCHDLAQCGELVDYLDDFGELATVINRVRHSLGNVARHLAEASTSAGLYLAQYALAEARVDLDPALFCNGGDRATSMVDSMELPDVTRAWFAEWQEPQRRLFRAQHARYCAADTVTPLLAAALRQRRGRVAEAAAALDPHTDRWVTVKLPWHALLGRGEAARLTEHASRLIRDVLLVHTPTAWFDTWALYRLPAGQAAALLSARGLTADGGPVLPADDESVLAAAAAVFDGDRTDAPLHDPLAALAVARDLTSVSAAA